jgi:mRNA interferase MazF
MANPSMHRGDIYLGSFPFGDQAGMKLRPVFLLTSHVGTGNEVIVAYISSVIPATLLASDLLIDPAAPEFLTTRLKTVSVLRLHKIATIHTASLQRRLGTTNASVVAEVELRLRAILSLQ